VKIRSTNHSTRAVTLIEVLMATVIIAILGSGVISSINYGLFIMRITRENQRATQVMLERLESIRLYNWDQVTNNGFVPVVFSEAYDPSAPTNAQGIIYYGTMAIASPVFSGTTPSYADTMRQFTVTLQWTNAGAVAHTRTINTYVAQNGMQNYVY
jgi:prepilin-type N-terminal cleavage/methylation domain-containing protein